MHDDDLTRALRALDQPADPDPAFGDALYERLRTEVAAPRSASVTRFLAPLAAAILVIAAAGLGVAAGTGFVNLPWMVADASPSPSATAVSSPGAMSTPPASVPELSGDPAAGFAPDALVATTVDGLTLRAEPGTTGEPLGFLSEGSVSFVAGGPTAADGYQWYLLSGLGLPPASGCGPGSEGTEPYTCPIWFGWAAATDLDGTPWLEARIEECPEPASELEQLTLGRSALMLLHCYGDRDLSFRAWWPSGESAGTVCEAGVPWLGCARVVLGWNEDYPEAITVAVDPADGITFPERGQWIRVRAQMDHPEAASCGTAADQSIQALEAILRCRTQLAVTAVEPAPAP